MFPYCISNVGEGTGSSFRAFLHFLCEIFHCAHACCGIAVAEFIERVRHTMYGGGYFVHIIYVHRSTEPFSPANGYRRSRQGCIWKPVAAVSVADFYRSCLLSSVTIEVILFNFTNQITGYGLNELRGQPRHDCLTNIFAWRCPDR
jgi:hypothetical protein